MLVETNNFTIESLGIQEEWVYDIEVADCHNFFGNGVLLHNSSYLELNNLIERVVPQNTPTNTIVDYLSKFSDEVVTPFIDEKFAILSNYLNAIDNTLKMKREVICDRGIWRAKKNYILQVWDNENVRYAEPKLKSVGVETARTSTPNIVKNELEACFKLILNGTEADLQQRVKSFKAAYPKLDLYDIAKPTGVNDIGGWSDVGLHGNKFSWKSGTPVQVKASLTYNNQLFKYGLDKEYQLITNGMKVRYLYLIKQNPTLNNAIAFTDELLEEFGLDKYVDKETQFNKTFLKPLESFTNLVNWSPVKVNNLNQFRKQTTELTVVEPQHIIKPKTKKKEVSSLRPVSSLIKFKTNI